MKGEISMGRKQIYFYDLPELAQQRILDMYGAESADELNFLDQPIAIAHMDGDTVGALELLEPAV